MGNSNFYFFIGYLWQFHNNYDFWSIWFCCKCFKYYSFNQLLKMIRHCKSFFNSLNLYEDLDELAPKRIKTEKNANNVSDASWFLQHYQYVYNIVCIYSKMSKLMPNLTLNELPDLDKDAKFMNETFQISLKHLLYNQTKANQDCFDLCSTRIPNFLLPSFRKFTSCGDVFFVYNKSDNEKQTNKNIVCCNTTNTFNEKNKTISLLYDNYFRHYDENFNTYSLETEQNCKLMNARLTVEKKCTF